VAGSLVLVNGLPGAGKTTLATALAGAMRVPLVTKDGIKEALADLAPMVGSRVLGAAAMELAWAVAAALPGPVILESWWFRLAAGRGGVVRGAGAGRGRPVRRPVRRTLCRPGPPGARRGTGSAAPGPRRPPPAHRSAALGIPRGPTAGPRPRSWRCPPIGRSTRPLWRIGCGRRSAVGEIAVIILAPVG
jgi:hypothetical protein